MSLSSAELEQMTVEGQLLGVRIASELAVYAVEASLRAGQAQAYLDVSAASTISPNNVVVERLGKQQVRDQARADQAIEAVTILFNGVPDASNEHIA
jgi:hypothetical protein